MERLFCLLIGYGCGMFLTAAVYVKIKTGKSVADFGTGNPGMANVTAQFGVKAGALVLAGDIAKTALACTICRFAFQTLSGPEAALYAGLGAALGHNFPLWRKGRGGKGVAVTCTALAWTLPLWGVLSSAGGLLIVLLTGYLPLGAVVIPAVFVPAAFFFAGPEAGTLAVILAAMMLLQHRHGLARIQNRSEKKICLIKRKQDAAGGEKDGPGRPGNPA